MSKAGNPGDPNGRNALSRRGILFVGTSLAAASALGSTRAQSSISGRDVLPIPDRKAVGLTTYDAKDPDTKFPPIKQLRPPSGAQAGIDTTELRSKL